MFTQDRLQLVVQIAFLSAGSIYLKTLPELSVTQWGLCLLEATETLLKASTDVYLFAARLLLYSSHLS